MIELDDDMLVMDGFDDCIAGIVERCGQPPIVCYDREAVIEKLMKETRGSYEEAEEFFEFNQVGAWLGDSTPCFITLANEATEAG